MQNTLPAPLPDLSWRQRLGGFVDRHFLILAAWPALVIMLAVTAVPFAGTIGLSFTNYDLVRYTSWRFIGLGNFADLIKDQDTHRFYSTPSTSSSAPPSWRRSLALASQS